MVAPTVTRIVRRLESLIRSPAGVRRKPLGPSWAPTQFWSTTTFFCQRTGRGHKTLQYIGCSPSGKLELLPIVLVESNNSDNNNSNQPTTMGSSRGLGAAPPTDTL